LLLEFGVGISRIQKNADNGCLGNHFTQ
jgi:hypothetical protein